MSYPYFYVYFYLNKESVKLERLIERLPDNVDLEYELRMILYDDLKPYMDKKGKGDFLVTLVARDHYYKVYVDSLGDHTYEVPYEFVEMYIDRYISFKVPGSKLQLEYEIDTVTE
jgi:hypothetical protein